MIAVLEDDEEIRNMILYMLKVSAFDAVGFKESSSFYEYIKNEKIDLLLLDIMLPQEDGISVLKRLKCDNRYSSIPVIMTTAKGTELDKVTCLDLGADDYLVKPFGMMEMIARVKAVLRRMDQNKKDVYKNGELILDDSKHKVLLFNKNVDLSLKEYEVLKILMKNIGNLLTREVLFEKIWGYDYVGESRTIDVHVASLRNKLDVYGDTILTIRGVGYKMVYYDEKENI